MTVRRPFSKPRPRVEQSFEEAPAVRFRHRFDHGDVIDLTAVPEPGATPRRLDRAARRAAQVAQVGYGLCLAALAQPCRPSLSRAT